MLPSTSVRETEPCSAMSAIASAWSALVAAIEKDTGLHVMLDEPPRPQWQRQAREPAEPAPTPARLAALEKQIGALQRRLDTVEHALRLLTAAAKRKVTNAD